ncbi:hypothetical protein DM01DRAFT_1196221 [Hesseltinella vesiculosa]|uniref:Uncharacterized protein n=1 Tax=Hesseltinella vesiculosa TaxID=101127 RepID=A0A1X2G4P9_9FUNG|nr:hypothetical protein DM01DRAFT_1196221 [Hesseltinella vesiculosa]
MQNIVTVREALLMYTRFPSSGCQRFLTICEKVHEKPHARVIYHYFHEAATTPASIEDALEPWLKADVDLCIIASSLTSQGSNLLLSIT